MKRSGPRLSIVIPTRNELDNVVDLVRQLSAALEDVEWEAIFVDDDSPDRTAALVRSIAAEDHRIRCLQRIGRRGLASAAIEGMLASSAPFLALMDGDGQHDPTVLRTMLRTLETTNAEIVVGTRYMAGGSVGDWSMERQRISRFATRIGRAVMSIPLRDPMSGCFMLRRQLFDEVAHGLSGLGFKLLLDIFATARRPVEVREVPLEFRTRQGGQSKLDERVAWEFLMLLADKRVGRWVPVRFVAFATIGAIGLLVHLATLSAMHWIVGSDFVPAQTIATLTAMCFNYALNNELTYRDRRRRGVAWWTGLGSFVLVCGAGAIANIGIASYLFYRHAGWILSAIAGVAVGAVWNYAVTGLYTWGIRKAYEPV